MRSPRFAAVLAFCLFVLLAVAGGPLHAQACTVASGAATWTIPATSHYDVSPTSNFTGVGTGDYLFEDGWWFRVSGDAQEFFFPAPTTTTCAAAAGTITWSNVSARGFDASLAVAITSLGAGSGEVIQTMTITNLSDAAPLTIDLFHFADFDVNGTAGTDTATLGNPNTFIQVADTTAGTAEYRAFGPAATSYMVRAFGAADVAVLLGDADVDNLDNTGLPFASGDITSAFQWSLVIPALGSASVSVALTGNQPATPVELLQFSID
ncbi:MAG: hypothetical protein KBF21_01410 [Thermoanaerobaculia bacterium]|jgi:hypothetical protein|nr:hypothetical protein [Thermoanaerobaculia bacterium]MBP9822856.1 hypothetical protein [Thermoanaerobaculia bacterium]